MRSVAWRLLGLLGGAGACACTSGAPPLAPIAVTADAPSASREDGRDLAEREAEARALRERRARLLLQRLAYGPRPGDVERVARDPDAWLQAQLSPPSAAASETLDDDFPELRLDYAALVERYPRIPAAGRRPGQPTFHELRELLVAAKLARGVRTERQLEEVLVDFWFNHFNVHVTKGDVRWSIVDYERSAIRPHVFGRFRELLGATAHHPAMLYYLDNWLSSAERPARGKKAARGLNENYGRELLELHTLGVDGGYTQSDVREVALAFTGWSLAPGHATHAFRPERHAPGPRSVLGTTIEVEGEAQGEAVLDVLASHPSTARRVAYKLAQKFVSDTPPPELVRRLAGAFSSSLGDLRHVYAELFSSPEFEASADGKTKTPLELVLSALRAVDARHDGSRELGRLLERMGQPLYAAEAPTGYRETADGWVNAGGLVARLNFCLALGDGAVPGVEFDEDSLLGGWEGPPEAWLDELARRVLVPPLGETTRRTILVALNKQSETQAPDDAHVLQRQALGLLLGSPEFQRQ